MHYQRPIGARGVRRVMTNGVVTKRAPSTLTPFDPIRVDAYGGKPTLVITATSSGRQAVRRTEGEAGIALPRRDYSDNQ